MAEKQCNLIKNGGDMKDSTERIVGTFGDKTRYGKYVSGTVSTYTDVIDRRTFEISMPAYMLHITKYEGYAVSNNNVGEWQINLAGVASSLKLLTGVQMYKPYNGTYALNFALDKTIGTTSIDYYLYVEYLKD